MVNDWQRMKLGQVCQKIGSGATPRGGKDAYRGGDTALIRSQNIYNNRFAREGIVYINDSQAQNLRNVVVEKGDVLLNITGDSVARCCQVDPGILPARVNQHVLIIRTKPEILDSRFLRYVLVSPSMQDRLLALASAGATRNALTKAMIESLCIQAPLVEEQRAIAHILGTLDDKIELNRKQNETLEAMARAMFKAWFVDFEPVRAKMEGRWKRGQSLPGMPAHLYDLFPDRMVESELGEIPEGWSFSTIGEEVTLCGGSTPSTKETAFWENGKHCWATPKDLSGKQFPVLMDTDRKITDAGLAKISSGLLPVGTVLLSSRAPIGYLAIAEVPTAINQGFIAMKCNGVLSSVFVLMWCVESMEAIIGKSNGSTFQEVSKSSFRSLPVVISPALILDGFSKIVEPLYRRIVVNERESRFLARIRDVLLPELISGGVRIQNAE